jgi:hypothetical protein
MNLGKICSTINSFNSLGEVMQVTSDPGGHRPYLVDDCPGVLEAEPS